MRMMNNCLYCYEAMDVETDFHAKCAKAFFGTATVPPIPYSINEMNELARQVVERSIAVPGVQPKLSMSVVKERKPFSDARLTVVGALGGEYILKPPSEHYAEMPANEHVTMRIAEAFGMRVVPSSLIRLQSGELCYITKRIDRAAKAEKIHMLDMFQITEAYDKYKSSMEKIGKAIHAYSDNTMLDKIFYFELALFSFLTGNNDMHLKNFSLIKSESGWVLAPAYDLLNVALVNPDDKEELALTLDGKKKKLKVSHFVLLAEGMGLNNKQIDAAFKRVVKNRELAITWIRKSFLSRKMKKDYLQIMESRYAQLKLVPKK